MKARTNDFQISFVFPLFRNVPLLFRNPSKNRSRSIYPLPLATALLSWHGAAWSQDALPLLLTHVELSENIEAQYFPAPEVFKPAYKHPSKQAMTGDWNGLRSYLESKGYFLEIRNLVEPAANARGGSRKLATAAGEFRLSPRLDLDKIIGLPKAFIEIIAAVRYGEDLSDLANLQQFMQPQEIYGRGQTVRMVRFAYNQSFLDDHISWKIGRSNLNDDFANFDCISLSLYFCGGQVGNLLGDYWYNYPVSQWMSRLQLFSPSKEFYVKFGAYEANPKNVYRRYSVAPPYDGATGVIAPVELGWAQNLFGASLPGLWKIGGWYDTSTAKDVVLDIFGGLQSQSGLPAMPRKGRYGGFVFLEQQLYHSPGSDDPKGGLRAFFNMTQSERRTEKHDNQISAGVLLRGLFSWHPKDDLLMGFSRTHTNSRVTGADIATGTAPGKIPYTEYVAEAAYIANLADWMTFMPNLQYVMIPGGMKGYKNTLNIGARSIVQF